VPAGAALRVPRTLAGGSASGRPVVSAPAVALPSPHLPAVLEALKPDLVSPRA